MKTLAVILHHNTVQHTDTLYEMLYSEQESGNYELVVLDNGSDKDKTSKYTTLSLDENVYFGGALDACFGMVMENPEYDSLLYLNNDLIVGKNFVKSLRGEGGYHNVKGVENPINFDIVSPCIIQPEKTQNHWKQMLPWGSNKCRPVRWIDLQAPLISRKFIQHFHNAKTAADYFDPLTLGGVGKTNGNYLDPLLLRGWGIDVYFGIICETEGWKTGVCDHVPAIHLGSMTLKSIGNTNEYCRLAEQGMFEFFQKAQLLSDFTNMRKWAEQYAYVID